MKNLFAHSKIYFSLIVLIFTMGNRTMAQSLTVNARLDTNMILIGDQVKFTLEVTQPENFVLQFPELYDTIIGKIEIVEKLPIDTIRNDKEWLLKQQMLITSFDSGIYLIPRLPFAFKSPVDGNLDTIYSPSMYFGVNTFTIDTTNAIFDIKLPIPAPFTLAEAAPWIGGFALLVIVVIGVMYYIRLRKGQESIILRRQKPKEPAHIKAYRELDELKSMKLWQQGKIKEFHSRLTEIVRGYIEARYEVMALEMTSYEIMDSIKKLKLIDKDLQVGLNDMLTLADFVKFAKANPLPDENEKCMNYAYRFVDKTKPVVLIETEDSDEKKAEVVEPIVTEN